MHIILLFGGSDGQYESMLARVYNQLGDVIIDEKCVKSGLIFPLLSGISFPLFRQKNILLEADGSDFQTVFHTV